MYHIEAYSEQPDPITFACEDCGEKWQGAVETYPCEIEGCNIIGCPTCRTVCYFCNQAICSAHRVKYLDAVAHAPMCSFWDGTGGQNGCDCPANDYIVQLRWTCAPCKKQAEARDREDGRQVA